MSSLNPPIRENDRIDTRDDWSMSVWARHFNVSEKRVQEAVAAVGDRALRVREHLHRGGTDARSEHPSAH